MPRCLSNFATVRTLNELTLEEGEKENACRAQPSVPAVPRGNKFDCRGFDSARALNAASSRPPVSRLTPLVHLNLRLITGCGFNAPVLQ